MAELAKTYDPAKVETKWKKKWLDSSAFSAMDKSDKPPYSIVIPPPNVTGALHIGHALNSTLQDILIRYKRMDGFNTLWVPGCDHAGIATQNVVEKALAKEGKGRHDLGREKFVEKVWEWKEHFGGRIVNQLKTLGASCDWERERFTMDEGLSKAVREVFVSLYEDGLIYQGEYLVNWCPRCHTALSDLEVEHEERDGHFWHIEYKIEDSDEKFVIATTRPETLLGDSAVAVHPEDERYKHLVGKKAILPLVGRKIEIIADEYVDKEFGSGALKVTPAHDPNDFMLGRKHSLAEIKIFDESANINENGGKYEGLNRTEARKQIVADLEKAGLLVKVEPHRHSVGGCYRCQTTVEPSLSNQWFVKVAPLAEPAIKAVENGDIRFVPKNWENTYFEWMRNIRDWCISRQIWWGHRIPAWTCADCGKMHVLREDPDKCPECGSENLTQESDVLDTWFSSALWPFSTLGWPEKTETLETFYPTSVLVTSFDIIFFWVARMIMMGLRFRGEVPFRDVYIHALVRDDKGQKMSKSRGNTIDPLEIMESHGADAMRMTLTALAAQGRDIKLSPERIDGYRNFVNKLWNASRFALMNLDGFDFASTNIDRNDLELPDRWILSRLNQTIDKTRNALDNYRFNEAASEIYRFTWHELCDWYLEIIKPRLGGNEPNGDSARHTLVYTLETVIRLISPVMPFVGEELWQHFNSNKGDGENDTLVCNAPYPKADSTLIDETIEEEMGLVMDMTGAIRNVRGELGIKPSMTVEAIVFVAEGAKSEKIIERQIPFISKLSKTTIKVTNNRADKPEESQVAVARDVEIFINLAGLAGAEERKAKTQKEFDKLNKEIGHFEKKLSNENFVKNAPPEVVEKNRAKLAEYKEKAEKLKQYL